MNLGRYATCFLGCTLLGGLLFVAGCKQTVTAKSRWTDEKIVVDGQESDWRDGGMFFQEETNTKIGIRNDSSDLYFCMVFKNESIQRQVLQQGFTLWVSKDQETDRIWGLRYPVGSGMTGGFERPGRDSTQGNPEYVPGGKMRDAEAPEDLGGNIPGGGMGSRQGAPDNQNKRFFSSVKDFELLSSEDEPGQPILAEELSKYGLKGSFSMNQEGSLVYEIKIPLNKTEATPYAAVPSKKGSYLIGFVSEEAENQGMEGGMGRGGIGGGMNFSGNGGGMGSGMGGGRSGGRGEGQSGEMSRGGMNGPATATSIELWVMVELATASATQ